MQKIFWCFRLYLIVAILVFPVLSSAQQIVRDVRDKDQFGQQKSSQSTVPSLEEVNLPQTALQKIPASLSSSMSDMMLQSINVHVLGDVSIPGIHKAKMSDRITDVLSQSQPGRQNPRLVEVRRPGEKTQYYDLYRYYYFGDLSQNPYLSDNDTVFVPNQKGAVRIEGPVARNGVYELNNEKTLDQIVRLAGGFTSSLSKTSPLKVIRFVDGGQKNVLNVLQDPQSLKEFSIQHGDVIIVPDVVNAGNKFDYALESIPGENLVYPTATPDVFVIGSVLQPGPYPYKSHLSIKDYLGFAGATGDASLRSVTVLRDGKRKRMDLYKSVQAGDVVIVKQKASNEFVKYLGIGSTIVSVSLSAIILNDYLK